MRWASSENLTLSDSRDDHVRSSGCAHQEQTARKPPLCDLPRQPWKCPLCVLARRDLAWSNGWRRVTDKHYHSQEALAAQEAVGFRFGFRTRRLKGGDSAGITGREPKPMSADRVAVSNS